MDAYNPHLLQHLSQLHREELQAVANHHRLARCCPAAKGLGVSAVHAMGAWLERVGRRMQGKSPRTGGALLTEFRIS